MHVSASTRKFMNHWAWLTRRYPKLMDQDIANWVLLAQPGQTYYHRHLDWGTWPRNLATGLLEDVNTNETAAFHAIFVSGIGPKLGRIAEGIVRGQARVPACAPHRTLRTNEYTVCAHPTP